MKVLINTFKIWLLFCAGLVLFTGYTSHAEEKKLKLGLGSRITPKENIEVYKDIVSYLAKKTGWKVELIQTSSYITMNKLLETGKVDVAFICTGAFKKGMEEGWAEALVMPVIKGEPYYYAYLIARPESKAKDILDFKGKSFAFTDPLSLTGFIVPTEELKKKGINYKGFFSNTIFTRSHDRSVVAVARGIVEGASVDSLVFDYYIEFHPEMASKIKIIKRYGPFPSPPLATSRTIDREIKTRIQDIFIKMNKDDEGRAILNSLGIDYFVIPEKDFYKKG